MAILSVKNISIKINDSMLIESSQGLDINQGDVVLLSGKNGCGKSTLIKLVMDDLWGTNINSSADIFYENLGNISQSGKLRQQFNQQVCYVPQTDEFEASRLIDCCLTSVANIKEISNKEKYILNFVKKHHIYAVCYPDGNEVALRLSDWHAKRLLAKCGIPLENADQGDIKSALLLTKNPERLSGGQKKIANILSAIVRCEYSKLIIIDEPLNALDFANVRLFSNIITSIHYDQPQIGMLIVTHCRALAALNRVVAIEDGKLNNNIPQVLCTSCFGRIDANGFYV